MTSKSFLSILTALTLGLGAASQSRAAIIVTLPTAVAAGSIVITDDISFTITTAGIPRIILLDEWVSNDNSFDTFSAPAYSPSVVSYSINGGATLAIPHGGLTDNVTFAFGAATANDGIFGFGNNSVGTLSVGTVFTLKAATYVVAAGAAASTYNPQAGQTFTGNAILTTDGLAPLSANTPVGAVPEPGTALLGALAGGLSLLRRRRSH